jgi:hypothetical protein
MPSLTTRMPEDDRQDLNELAAEMRMRPSSLARVFIVKGIAALRRQPRSLILHRFRGHPG